MTTTSPVLPTPSYPWFVRKNQTNVCILAKFGAKFIVSDKEFVLPSNASVTKESVCGDDKQVIQLQFDQKSLSFTFMRNENTIFVNKITFSYPTSRGFQSVQYNGTVFETPKNYDYKCFSEQNISFDESVMMNIMNVQLEAFKSGNYNETNGDLNQWERVGLKCQLDRIKTDAWKITGISLGVGILVLSIITLVAIWSGRRQENLMLKIKMQRQWTVDDRDQNVIINSSKYSSTQSIIESQNNNDFKHQRY